MAGNVDISDLEFTTFFLEAWPGPITCSITSILMELI